MGRGARLLTTLTWGLAAVVCLHLSGSILELVPDKKIAETWRGSDEGWAEGHYSTATFSLDEIDGGTRLTFVQTGVPEQSYERISQGWETYYWPKMKEYFKS